MTLIACRTLTQGLLTRKVAAALQMATMIRTYTNRSGHRQPKQFSRERRVVQRFRFYVCSYCYATRALS